MQCHFSKLISFVLKSTNILLLMCRPEVESKSMRFKMLTEHKNVIGQSRAFDGAILYLPIKITEKVRDARLLLVITCTHKSVKQPFCDLYAGTETYSQ